MLSESQGTSVAEECITLLNESVQSVSKESNEHGAHLSNHISNPPKLDLKNNVPVVTTEIMVNNSLSLTMTEAGKNAVHISKLETIQNSANPRSAEEGLLRDIPNNEKHDQNIPINERPLSPPSREKLEKENALTNLTRVTALQPNSDKSAPTSGTEMPTITSNHVTVVPADVGNDKRTTWNSNSEITPTLLPPQDLQPLTEKKENFGNVDPPALPISPDGVSPLSIVPTVAMLAPPQRSASIESNSSQLGAISPGDVSQNALLKQLLQNTGCATSTAQASENVGFSLTSLTKPATSSNTSHLSEAATRIPQPTPPMPAPRQTKQPEPIPISNNPIKVEMPEGKTQN